MVVSPTYYWPLTDVARGSGMAPYVSAGASGVAIADWSVPQLWIFASGLFTQVPFTSGGQGFCGATADLSGNVWGATCDGYLYELTSGGASLLVTGLPSGAVYTGIAAGGPSGYTYTVNSSGVFYGFNGTGLVNAAFGAGQNTVSLAANATSLYTMLPSLNGIGTYNLGAATSGLLALPTGVINPMCLCCSGTTVAVGGWANAPALSGASGAAINPNNPTYMGAASSNGLIIWSSPGASSGFSDNWNQTQFLNAGVYPLNALAWRPDGQQILATSVADSYVQIFNNVSNILSLEQTIACTSACAVAIAANSTHALVCQSGQAQITPFYYAGATWSAESPITELVGIRAVAAFNNYAFAIYNDAIAVLTVNGTSWNVANTITLPYTPLCVCVDSFGLGYVAGGASTTYVTQFTSGGAILASGSLTRNPPTSIAVQQGRIIIATSTPVTHELNIMGLGPSGITLYTSQAINTGTQVGLALSNTTLFVMGSGATNTFGFSGFTVSGQYAPYGLSPTRYGAVGVYNESSWTTVELGIGNVPSAISFDTAGNIQVVDFINTWWTILGGAVTASGIIPQYATQPQNVPLCVSAIASANSHLYASTSIPGTLIDLE